MVRCIRFRAESISRATSSGLSTVGSFRGHLGNGISSSRYGRRRVLTKRKRSAEDRLRMVRATASDREQMNLVLPNVARAQALRRAMEVLRKVFHRANVVAYSVLRIVATLEFIQHALPKMGHGKPPVTRSLHSHQCQGTPMQQRPSRQRLSSNADCTWRVPPSREIAKEIMSPSGYAFDSLRSDVWMRGPHGSFTINATRPAMSRWGTRRDRSRSVLPERETMRAQYQAIRHKIHIAQGQVGPCRTAYRFGRSTR